jgi:hypothetical protein
MQYPDAPPSSAHANFTVAKNTTFSDAIQFGEDGDTSWSFTNKTFRMGIKGNFEQSPEVIAFTSAAGEIVVADAAERVLYFNVPPATLQAVLVPGVYLYDLRMIDTDTAVRTQLLHGEFIFVDAVTEG